MNKTNSYDWTETLPSISFLNFYFYDTDGNRLLYYTIFDTGIMWIFDDAGYISYIIEDGKTVYQELIDSYTPSQHVVSVENFE